jgi:hypothetical protein
MAKHQRSGEREQRWRDLIARFAVSGLSVRAFCQRERVPESAFYCWRRTLQQRDLEATSAAPTFLPVAIQRPERATAAAETCVELPGGVTIRVGEATSIERVAALVRALQREEAHA